MIFKTAALILALVGTSDAKSLRNGRQLEQANGINSGPSYSYKLSADDFEELEGGLLKKLPTDAITGAKISFAEVKMNPGGVRDLHWHATAAEWAYIPEGRCEITLMDDNNRYTTLIANTGDVYYFPLGWQHSIQGIDPEKGCTTLLFFDDADGIHSINLSDTIAAYPDRIVKASLNGIPEEKALTFPKKQNSIAKGEIQDTPLEQSDNPLDLWPAFPVEKGTRKDSGTGGIEYGVRQEQLTMASTMSGGRIELEEGGTRELHWHTNADELHYVLSGTIRNRIHGNDGKITEYEISAGDVGYVPLNFVHYIEAVGGPAVVIVTFNHPSWGTQGLSGMMSVTPTHIMASTLNTTLEVAEGYFPKESTAFLSVNEEANVENDAMAMSP